MSKKKTVLYQGHIHEGEDLEFTTEKDAWIIIKAEDGTEIKLKPAVSRIVRSEQFTPEGEPIYIVNSTLLISQNVPDELKNYKSDTLRPKPPA